MKLEPPNIWQIRNAKNMHRCVLLVGQIAQIKRMFRFWLKIRSQNGMKQIILRLHGLKFFLLIRFLFINVLSAGLISLSRMGIIAEGFRDIYAGVAGTDSIRWPIQSLILEKYRFQNGLNIYSIGLNFILSPQLLSITEIRQQRGNTGFVRCLRSWKESRVILWVFR